MDKGAKAVRLADQIRDLVAAWILKDVPGCFVSVVQVQLSENLQRATVWLEAFDQPAKAAIGRIKRLTPQYQARLYREMGRRNIPTISFRESHLADADQRLDELLKP